MKRSTRILLPALAVAAAICLMGTARASDFTYVCQDAGVGAYEAFPDVCRLSDGRLFCVYYAGYGHVSLPNDQLPKGGCIAGCYSSDEGRTWSESFILFDGPNDDRDPSVVQISDGTVYCNYFSLEPSKEGGKDYQGLGTFAIASKDFGKTWSEPVNLSADYYCSSPIRELSDGTLILGLYAQTESGSNGAVIRSEDKGKTWGPVIDIDNGGYQLDAETDIVELKDGTLYAAQRAPKEDMAYSLSSDKGKSWTVSKHIGFPGHCPYFLRTGNDIILLAHRLPQTSLHYSLDECKTWSENVLVDDFIGAYPSLVNLKDGSVLIVYYEEGDKSSIRAKRLKATPQGIEWLKFEE